MRDYIDLDRYPIDRLQSAEGQTLLSASRRELAELGMFNLEGFLKAAALRQCIDDVMPVFEHGAFTHRRSHNIYFEPTIPELPAGHPALRQFETVNHTVCADQIPGSLLCRIYEWPPLAAFLAAVMDKPELHVMADPLARANVMSYGEGEALNWHFDRSEFTTTLLLQAPDGGGKFQYRRDLRGENDPNHAGVGRLLAGEDGELRTLPLEPGTLNVFKGKYSAHRVTPVEGPTPRIIAVFSYYEEPGRLFSEEERLGFYGRSEPLEAAS